MEDIILLNTPFICGKDQRTPNSSRSDFLLEQNRISGQITAVRTITIRSQSIILTLTVRLATDRYNGLVKPSHYLRVTVSTKHGVPLEIIPYNQNALSKQKNNIMLTE